MVGRLIAWLRSLNPWVKALGGLIAAVGVIVPLVLTFWPGLAPAPPCRGELDGTLSGVRVDRSVTYETYLESIGASTDGVPEARLARVGKLVGFDVSAVGYKGKQLPVRWSTHLATGELASEPELRDQLAMKLEPQECRDRGRRSIWTPIPRTPGAYFVRVVLNDPHDEELSSVDTAHFSVTGAS